MKNLPTNPSASLRLAFLGTTLTLLTLCLLPALTPRAAAQTYTLTNVWNVAAGTEGLSTGSDGGNRSVAYSAISNQVFVSYRAGGSNLPVMVFDGTAGTWLSGASGVTGSLGLNCDQIGVGDDGILYGCPLNTGVTSSSAFKIYSWTNWNNSPYNCFSSGATDPIVTETSGATARRVGDSFAVTGAGTNTLILAGIGSYGAFALFSTTDGVNFTSTVLTNNSIGAIANVSGLAFYTNNTFIAKVSSSGNAYLIQYPTNFASLPGPVTVTVLGSVSLTGTTGGATQLSYSSAGQLLGAVTQTASSTDPVALFSMTNFPTTATSVASTTFATPNSNGNETGGAALGGTGKTNYLYAMGSDNGLHAYQIIFTTAPVAPTITTEPASAIGAYAPQTLTVAASGTQPITNLWYSNTSSNATGGTLVQSSTNTSYTVATALTNYYYVIVANAAGSQTSSVVELSLIPAVTNAIVTNLFSIAPGSQPYEANDDNTRGLDYDPLTGHLVIANKNGGAHVYLVDGTTGTNLGQMNTSGMYSGGTFPIDQVGVAADGVVYAGNLALTASLQSFNLTSWSSATTNATLYNAYPANDPGNGSGDRWGDTMSVRGAGTNTQILIASRGTNIALFTTTDGTDFTPTLIGVPGVPTQFAGYGVAFGAGNTFWAKNYNGDLYEISFDPTLVTNPAVLLDYVHGSQIPSAMVGVGVDTVHSILGGVDLADQNPDLQLFQLTGNANPPVLFDQAFFPAWNPSANGNLLGVVSMKYPRCYAMDVDLGIIGVTYGVPVSTPPTITPPSTNAITIYASGYPYSLSFTVSGTLPLYYQWQSNSVSNLSTAINIPGATAAAYTFNPPTTNSTAWYDVIVTNFGGAATSAPVLVTVVSPVTSPYVTNIWKLAAGGSNAAILDSSTYNVRGLAYDSNTATVLLANHATTNITVLNASNGSASAITINTAGLPVGTFTLDQIAVADDGVLYGGNLALTPGDTFAITQWSAVSSGASLYPSYTGDPGNGSGDRWGDTMAIRGAGTNTQILLGSYGQGYGPGTSVALLTTVDGQNFTALNIPVAGMTGGFAGLGIAFGAGNTFWCKGGHFFDLRQISFDPTGSNAAVVLEDYSAGIQTPNDLTGLGVDAANNILIGTCFNDAPNDLQFYLLTGTTNSPVLFDQVFYASLNGNSQENAAAVIKYPWAFGLDVNNGLVAVQYSVPPAAIVPFNVTAAEVPGTGVVLSWPSVAGHTYKVLSSSTATTARSTWTTNATYSGIGGTLSYTNTTPSGTRFYTIQGSPSY